MPVLLEVLNTLQEKDRQWPCITAVPGYISIARHSFSFTLPTNTVRASWITLASKHLFPQFGLSLNRWHQPIVPFPFVAMPLSTLLAWRLRLWHTGIIVESTNVIPAHLPNARRLRKNIRGKNTLLPSSTKRLWETALGKCDLKAPWWETGNSAWNCEYL